MNNNNEQAGHQPPIPGQPPPPLENKKVEICRDFVWGTCNKNTKCRFRHEMDFEEMKKILKFCRDYQNRSGCTRELCTYLHTTKEEESLFYATGQLPQILAKRYANMSTAAVETITQIAEFIQESFGGAPPPPPPPPPPVPGTATAPLPPPVAPALPNISPVAPMLPLQQLPPPPPPPPVTTVQQQAPVFSAPAVPANNALYPMNTPPPPICVKFDTSMPPPPIPTLKKNSLKRQPPMKFDGQTKKRKLEEAKESDPYCNQCVQRNSRVGTYKQEMDKLCSEEEYNTLLYKKKLEEYQNRKELLRSLVSNDHIFRLIEEYVEGVPQLQVQDVLTQLNQTSFVSGTSSGSKQFLLQLMQFVLDNSRVDAVNVPSSGMRLDESVIQGLTRRTNSVGVSSPGVLTTLMDILRQSNTSEHVQVTDLSGALPRSSTLTTSTSTIGLQRFSNGQDRVESQVNRLAPPPPQAALPPPYHHYPAPPARMYYPPPFPVPPTGGAVATSQMTRVPPPPTPAPPPAPAPPPSPAPPSSQPSQQYSATRYPPPYYQRQQ